MQKHKKGALQKRQTFPVANSTTSGVLSTVLAVEVVVIELVVVLTARGLKELCRWCRCQRWQSISATSVNTLRNKPLATDQVSEQPSEAYCASF